MTTTLPARRSRLPHYIERWTYWMDEAERLDRVYVSAEVAHRIKHPDVEMQITWEHSRLARTLQASAEWAHRRAQTYALAILVCRELRADPSLLTTQRRGA